MPRNKTYPREYGRDPQERSAEKLNEVLRWLVQFHHSTRKIMLERLGLDTDSHHTYFKKLVEQGILQKIRVYSINERFIFMLSSLGKELASESYSEAIKYNVDSSKINHAELRHSLAIQNTVLGLIDADAKFISEKLIDPAIVNIKKRPDAAIIKNDLVTMLEVELTPKKDQRIFQAFIAHADALTSDKYQKVMYIFPSDTLKNYYLSRFNSEKWSNKEILFLPNDAPSLKDKFEFIADPRIIRNF
jgi:hypothetical protein